MARTEAKASSIPTVEREAAVVMVAALAAPRAVTWPVLGLGDTLIGAELVSDTAAPVLLLLLLLVLAAEGDGEGVGVTTATMLAVLLKLLPGAATAATLEPVDDAADEAGVVGVGVGVATTGSGAAVAASTS